MPSDRHDCLDAILLRVRQRVKQSGQGLLSFGRNCGENATVAECQPRLGNAEAERTMNDVFPSPPKRDFPMLERSKRRIGKIWSLRTRSGSKAIAFGFCDLSVAVIPAQAGIQGRVTGLGALDSRLRGNDRGEKGNRLAKCDCPAGGEGE